MYYWAEACILLNPMPNEILDLLWFLLKRAKYVLHLSDKKIKKHVYNKYILFQDFFLKNNYILLI